MRDCFELLNLDKQKVHTYAVPTDDKIAVCDLIKYMQEAIYAQTLHIEHILKVKYGWFLDAQIDYVADLVFCYRLFCSPMEFLNIFETRYPTVEEGKETLWHFIEGLEPADFEAEGQKNLKNKLDNMIALVQTQAMQSKMTRDMKKLTRTLHASPTISDGASSPVSSSPTAYRIGLSRSGSLRTISPSPSRRRMSSCAPSPPPLFLDNDALPTHPEISPAALSHFSTKDAWVGVSAQAQGITQRECDVFRRVRTQEVLVGEGPNIDEMLDLMSWTTRWVSTKILSYDSSETRADAISGFISLAAEFRKMNNFNGIMEITQSLRSAPIERLKESWQILPPNIVTEWASITELMSSSHSYHNYRQALKAIDFNSPCLPCILVIISDISAIDLPDWSEGKINMEYVRHVSALLREFRTYQKNCHSISTGVPELYSDLVLKEEDLEKLSLATCTENSTLPRNRANSISVKSIRKKKPNLQTSIFSRPVAAEFGPADWDRIMAVSETKTFQAGDTIANYNADEDSHKPQEFYYIKEGSVKATRTKGKWWYDVQAGDGIGLLTLLNLKFNKQIVATASPTVLKMANLSYVTQLLESDLDLATRFYKYVAKQVNSSLRFAMGQLTSQKPNGNRRSISAAFSYTSLSPSTPTSSPAPFSYLSGSPSTTPTSSPAPFSYTNPAPAPFSYTSATPAPFSYTNPAPSSLSSSSSSPSARTPSSPSSARTPSSPSSARAPSSPSTSRAPSPSPSLSSSSLSSSSLSSSSLSSSTSDLHVPTRKGSFTSLPTVSSNGPTAPGSPSAKIRTDVLNGNTPISSSSRSQSFSSNEPPLSELFTLEEDEVVIKSYECKFKRVNGRLYVTKYNLFFYGKSFGVQTKKQVPFATVAYVKATKQLEVKQEMKILKFYFKTQEEVNETEALIGSVFSKASQSNFDPNNIKSGPKSELDTVISPADWQLILTGTTTASYPAGSVIISEGVRHTRLCQILSGRCVITKKVSKNFVETTEKIASRHAGELFGEMSFLEPGSLASASVVADTDVEICILDFQYITVLLSVYRHLGPSLYKYLALLMHSRLAELEAK